jgi:hypothetical protein
MELEAPVTLVGKPATCPGCQTQFLVARPKSERGRVRVKSDRNVADHGSQTRAKEGSKRPAVTGAENTFAAANPPSFSPKSPVEHRAEPQNETSSADRPGETPLRLFGREESNAGAARFKGLPGTNDSTPATANHDSTPNAHSQDHSALQGHQASDVGAALSDNALSDNALSDNAPSKAALSEGALSEDERETLDSSETLRRGAGKQKKVSQTAWFKTNPKSKAPRGSDLPTAGVRANPAAATATEDTTSSIVASQTPADPLPAGKKSRIKRARRGAGEGPTGERQVRAAKLVAGASIDSRLQLGADGTLPQLNVVDVETKAKKEDANTGSNPLLLVAILVASLAVSVIALIAPAGNSGPERNTRGESLSHITEHYFGSEPFEDYQVLLREAVEHENRGELGQAREIYRRVLDLMHSESFDDKRGLTGPAYSEIPPSDSDLERHLRFLIRVRN